MFPATFAADYALGTANEVPVKQKLEKFLGEPLIQRGGMALFDYDNNNETKMVFSEVKTRRIRHDAYPTAIIGANKVNEAQRNPKNTYWFFFDYVDGLYGIKYDEEKFSQYERTEYSRGDRADFHNRPQECFFIPSGDLTRVVMG
jgi:hypothetical protein